jgi:hypothetical protein
LSHLEVPPLHSGQRSCGLLRSGRIFRAEQPTAFKGSAKGVLGFRMRGIQRDQISGVRPAGFHVLVETDGYLSTALQSRRDRTVSAFPRMAASGQRATLAQASGVVRFLRFNGRNLHPSPRRRPLGRADLVNDGSPARSRSSHFARRLASRAGDQGSRPRSCRGTDATQDRQSQGRSIGQLPAG